MRLDQVEYHTARACLDQVDYHKARVCLDQVEYHTASVSGLASRLSHS